MCDARNSAAIFGLRGWRWWDLIGRETLSDEKWRFEVLTVIQI